MGTGRGKLGDIVLYRSGGSQRARAYVSKIKNPRVDAQTLTRLATSSAAKTASALSFIVDHSYEGVSYGTASTRKFRSNAAKVIRAQAVAAYGGAHSSLAPVMPYTGYDAVVAPYILSSGSLASPKITIDSARLAVDGSRVPSVLPYFFVPAASTALSSITLRTLLNALGVSYSTVSDDQQQLTFVYFVPYMTAAEEGSVSWVQNRVGFVRLNFNAAALSLPAFVGDADNPGQFSINPAVLVSSRSNNVDKLIFVADELEDGELAVQCFFESENTPISGVGVIASQYIGGAWRRSNCTVSTFFTFEQNADGFSENNAVRGSGYNSLFSVMGVVLGTQSTESDWLLNRSLNNAGGSYSTGGQGNRAPENLEDAWGTLRIAPVANGNTQSEATVYDSRNYSSIVMPVSGSMVDTVINISAELPAESLHAYLDGSLMSGVMEMSLTQQHTVVFAGEGFRTTSLTLVPNTAGNVTVTNIVITVNNETVADINNPVFNENGEFIVDAPENIAVGQALSMEFKYEPSANVELDEVVLISDASARVGINKTLVVGKVGAIDPNSQIIASIYLPFSKHSLVLNVPANSAD